MRKLVAKNKGLMAVLALLGYLVSYAVLWGSREETMFAMTINRGCITMKREAPALRYGIERSAFAPFLAFAYWPLNTLRDHQSTWHE